MPIESYIKLAAFVVTPVTAVAWVLLQFFGKRIVASLDANAVAIAQFALRLEKVGDSLVHNINITNTEIVGVKEKISDIDAEVGSLRKDRHDHGTTLQTLTFKLGVIDEKLGKTIKDVEDLKEERIFVGDRIHDIINAISTLHGTAKHTYNWNISDTPNIRERKK